MTSVTINDDKNNKPTIIFNIETLFDSMNYKINRSGEVDGKLERVFSKFTNAAREMDISEDFFDIKRLIKELLVSGYTVNILNIVPNHPDTALALTQRYLRLKYFLGNDLVKAMNVISLDSTAGGVRYTTDKSLTISDDENDYDLVVNGTKVAYTTLPRTIRSINEFFVKEFGDV